MSDEYSRSYYQAIEREEMPQACEIARKITQFYKPQSVIDLGCGTGMYLSNFIFVPKRLGVDISPVAFELHPEENLQVIDLSKPQEFEKYDVGICFEVLEHIDQQFADIAIDNICKASDKLILTAALPFQPGLNHVNCQPQKYWEDKLVARGYKRNYFNEYWLAQSVSTVPHTMWIIKNLMVFEK